VSIRLSSYLGNAVTRLRASDLEAVLAFVAAAHAIDGPEPFTTELLGRMAELVPCESVFFNERDLIRRDLVSQPVWPAEEPHFDCWPLGEDEWSLIARHPLNIHRRRTGDFGVRHVSDLYSRRRRVRGEIYPEYFGQLGIVDFTGIALSRSQTHTLRFGLESKGRDFSDRDRLVLELLRPHLALAHQHARVRRLVTAAFVALENGAEERAPAVLLLGRGSIDFASRSARRLLERYFGQRGAGLPGELDGWLQDASAREKPYTKLRAGRRLVVEADRGNRSVLLLREERNTVPLTSREWDVIRCVAAGMSNAETARLLWVTPATIRKHLENIYGKLGVSSRTAALAKLGPRVVGEYQATDVADAPRSKLVNDSGSAEIGPGASAKT
jgi:DNA-binding CsgD family transcriptional regulator